MSAFTQMENMTGSNRDPSPLMDGSLIGVKNAMASVAVAITSEGIQLSFNTFFLVASCLGVSQVGRTCRSLPATHRTTDLERACW